MVNVFSKKITAAEDFHGMDVFNLRDKYLLNLAKSVNADNSETSNKSENISSNEVKFDDFSDSEDDIVDDSVTSVVSQDEYMPATRFKNNKSEIEEDYNDYYDIDINYKAQLVPYGTIHYPEHWNIFYCERGKFKKFPSPSTDASGLLSKQIFISFIFH